MRSHGKREPDIHPARITFHRRVEKLFDFGKRDDLIELSANFGAVHAENCAV